MDLFLYSSLLLVGLLLLWKTGDWAVSNAVRFSVVFQIESFIIGFFLFAVATGLPEITSAAVSSFKEVPELSAGNLIGSTFVNLSLQLGIASILARKLVVEAALHARLLRTIGTVTFIMIALLFIAKSNVYLGVGLIVLYAVSFLFRSKAAHKSFTKEVRKEEVEKPTFFSPKIDVLFKLLMSLSLLVASAWITVISAVNLAKMTGISLTLVGGTIIAIGTALPELTLEIHAVRRKEYGLALGDIFGSSLLNITLVFGLLVLLNPNMTLSIAKYIFPFFAPVAFWIFYRLVRKQPFTLYDGIAFIVIFSLYLVQTSRSFYS